MKPQISYQPNNETLKIPLPKDEPSWQEKPPEDETS